VLLEWLGSRHFADFQNTPNQPDCSELAWA
jgi:hypothetical protein